MKATLNQQIESAHAWVDEETGKICHTVIKGDAGDVLDTKTLDCGDAERAVKKIVTLGYAE